MRRLTLVLILVCSLAGCVRGRKPQPPTPVNIASATRQAWTNHANRLAEAFRQVAETPPATVTAAAEFTAKVDEASRQQFKRDMAAIMQPALPQVKDAQGEPTDNLDPVVARRVFNDIARGLSK